MAFNLFCPLRKILKDLPEEATRVIRAALPMYPIYNVTEVELEFRDKSRSMSLEEFTGSLVRNSPARSRETFDKFRNRYLDFRKLDS